MFDKYSKFSAPAFLVLMKVLIIIYYAREIKSLQGIQCQWQVTVTNPQMQVFQLNQSVIERPVTSFPGNSIDGLNLTYFKTSLGEQLWWLPYTIVAECLAENRDTHRISQSQAASRYKPLIELCDRHSKSPICRRLQSNPIDFFIYSGESGNCPFELCNPVWMTPLPLYSDDLVLDLRMHTGSNVEPLKFVLSVNGYQDLIDRALSAATLTAIKQHLNSVQQESPTLAIKVGLDLLAISNDVFKTSHVLDISKEISATGSIVCSCQWNSTVAVLTDRILIAHQTGLYEIRGSYIYNNRSAASDLRMSKLTSECIGDISVPVSCLRESWPTPTTFQGACGQQNRIYTAATYYKNEESLTVNEVLYVTNCSDWSLFQVSSCVVMDVVPVNNSALLILIHVTLPNSSFAFMILLQNDRSTSYIGMSTLSSDPGAHLAIPPFPSRTIFLWGKVVLASTDWGLTWQFIQDFSSDEVVTFQINTRGGFAALTGSSKVYGGHIAQLNLILIHPDSAWAVIHSFDQENSDPPLASTTDIISLLFGLHDRLHLFSLDGTSVKGTIMPFHDIMGYKLHTSDCSAVILTTRVTDVYRFHRIQIVYYEEPLVIKKEYRNNRAILLAYSSMLHSSELLRSKRTNETYANYERSFMSQWLNDPLRQTYREDLYSGSVDASLYVPVEADHRDYENFDTMLPRLIYLDCDVTLLFQVTAKILETPADIRLEDTVLSVTQSDPGLLFIDVSEEPGSYDTKTFEVNISCTTDRCQSMCVAGQINTYVGVFVEVTQSTCSAVENIIQSTVVLGCPPHLTVMFDANSSMQEVPPSQRVKFPDCDHFNTLDLPCFYFRNDFFPLFVIHDGVTGETRNYTGNYTLRVLGGGETIPQLERFTPEDVERYSSNTNNANLIFAPDNDSLPRSGPWPVFTRDQHKIIWLCQPSSPCDNLKPHVVHGPHYFLLMEFSNRFVDNSSFCNFTFEFVVNLHGIPLSQTSLGAILVGLTFIIQCFALLLYWICRCNKDIVRKKFVRCMKCKRGAVDVLEDETKLNNEPSKRSVPYWPEETPGIKVSEFEEETFPITSAYLPKIESGQTYYSNSSGQRETAKKE